MTPPAMDAAAKIEPKESDVAARRTRLREFQARLVERMHAASTGAQSQTNQLGVVIGETHWLLSLQQAGEIVSVGTMAKVPLTKDWFLGLTTIRGNLVSVVDLARFCGHAPTPVNKESRIVAFAPALSFNGSLLVSRVMGLRNVADMEVQEPNGETQLPWVARRFVDRDSVAWNELNLSLIVQDPHFLHVGL